MNFKGNTHKGAALPLPPLPSCRSLATHVPCGANWELQSVEIFPKYISLQADKYMCMPGTHTHSCIFTCTFIYKHARAFAVSKQRHKRRRGRKRAGGRVGKRHKSSAACEGEQKNVLNIQGKNHVVAAAAASVGVGIGVDCGTLRQDAKFNFTCGK